MLFPFLDNIELYKRSLRAGGHKPYCLYSMIIVPNFGPQQYLKYEAVKSRKRVLQQTAKAHFHRFCHDPGVFFKTRCNQMQDK